MKLKWIKKPDAPSQDLAAQLKAAQDALDAAKTATQKAQDSFDLTGTPEAQQVLTDAQDAERAAALHVGRAERLLSAAKAREAAELRQRQTAHVEEVRQRVSHHAALASFGSLIDREVAATLELVEIRTNRQTERRALSRVVDEAQRIAKELGLKRIDDHSGMVDSPIPVAEALLAHARKLETSDPRRSQILAIAHELSPSARAPMPVEQAEVSA